MPAKTQAMRASHLPKPASSLNFELPVFKFDHESLTTGTNIPPPSREPSPAPMQRKEKGEAAKPAVNGEVAKSHENGTAGTQTSGQTAEAAAPGTKRPHHVRRLLSLRSLSQTFSSHGRSDSMTSGTTAGVGVGGSSTTAADSDFGPVVRTRSRTPSIFGRNSTSTWRPESRSGASMIDSPTTDSAGAPADGARRNAKKRMSSGFWRRRGSMALTRLDEAPNEPANLRLREPPPQLPEIGKLDIGKVKTQDGNFLNGEDMFKGIEYRPEI